MRNIRVLLVDDEHDKAMAIAGHLSASKFGVELVRLSDAASAREKLKRDSFDLVLVDLHLPDSVSCAPNGDGGFQFYDLILMDGSIRSACDVVFVTAKEDEIDVAQRKCRQRGQGLCEVRLANDSWKEFLDGRLKFIAARVRAEADIESQRVDVVIVTAMRTPELSAVLELPWEWSQKRFAGDPSTYNFGVVAGAAGAIRVAAVSAPKKGMAASGALATKMVMRLRPKYLVMLGICAGIKGKTNFGDVVVGTPTWDWGSGKHAANADGSVVFKTGALQSGIDPNILEIAKDLAEEQSSVASLRAGWSGNFPAGALAIHTGPMATGASVLAHASLVEGIKDQNRDVIGVEMEAYAVMAAGEACGVTSIVAKSVCDFADSEKSDDWQAFASYTSARFFSLLVHRLPM